VAGERVRLTLSRYGDTTYLYDGAGRLAVVTTPYGESTAYEYNAVGLPTRPTQANGTVTTYEYNNRSFLTALANKESDWTTISERVYNYTANGHRLSF